MHHHEVWTQLGCNKSYRTSSAYIAHQYFHPPPPWWDVVKVSSSSSSQLLQTEAIYGMMKIELHVPNVNKFGYLAPGPSNCERRMLLQVVHNFPPLEKWEIWPASADSDCHKVHETSSIQASPSLLGQVFFPKQQMLRRYLQYPVTQYFFEMGGVAKKACNVPDIV